MACLKNGRRDPAILILMEHTGTRMAIMPNCVFLHGSCQKCLSGWFMVIGVWDNFIFFGEGAKQFLPESFNLARILPIVTLFKRSATISWHVA